MNERAVYVLDSNTISYFLKKNGGIDKAIAIALTNGDLIEIAPVAYYEVKRGLISVGALNRIRIFEDLCNRFRVGAIDKQVLSAASVIYADLRTRGLLIEDADILIAAYCVANQFTLVTHNLKHFINIKGLSVEDWVSEE